MTTQKDDNDAAIGCFATIVGMLLGGATGLILGAINKGFLVGIACGFGGIILGGIAGWLIVFISAVVYEIVKP